ncbi:unnamed protein product [Choristocarpus tenellus]
MLKQGFNDAANSCGFLSRASFSRVLKDLGFERIPTDRMFHVIDKDGNGQVSVGVYLPVEVVAAAIAVWNKDLLCWCNC